MRLDYSPFIISPRLSVNAIAQLLQLSHSHTLMLQSHFQKIVNAVVKAQHVKVIPAPTRDQYDLPASNSGYSKAHSPSDEPKVAIYTHSTGSTGVLRIIPFSHARLLNLAATAYKMRVFCTMPFFHGLGYTTLLQRHLLSVRLLPLRWQHAADA
jgi:acyl-CoA synthetase (AMP-forming)/AMP-acid ligase II